MIRFALLLIGNDWQNKGLPVLLDALARIRELPVDLLVVSREDLATLARRSSKNPWAAGYIFFRRARTSSFTTLRRTPMSGLRSKIRSHFRPPKRWRADSPSSSPPKLAFPKSSRMASMALILQDPRDATALAAMIRRLYEDGPSGRGSVEKAAETTQQYTWERNGRELAAIFEDILRGKAQPAAQALEQKP